MTDAGPPQVGPGPEKSPDSPPLFSNLLHSRIAHGLIIAANPHPKGNPTAVH